MHIGLHQFTENHMEFLHVMEFYLIMKVQEERNICYKEDNKIFNKKKLGFKDVLYLGNLNAKRDWGHAKITQNAMENLATKNQKIIL